MDLKFHHLNTDYHFPQISLHYDNFRSLGTVSYVDNPHDDDYLRHAVQFENTYQMEPNIRFPVAAITGILQETLATLKDTAYEPNECRVMTKTLSDVRHALLLQQ